jgi:hypothetical protein
MFHDFGASDRSKSLIFRALSTFPQIWNRVLPLTGILENWRIAQNESLVSNHQCSVLSLESHEFDTRLAVSSGMERSVGGKLQEDRKMTDDAIAKKILRFVRQLDGGESEDVILNSAIAHNWIDRQGRPTPDGRDLVSAFDDLSRISSQRH